VQQDWLRIGKVGRTHGLAGDFFVADRQGPLPATLESVALGLEADAAQHFSVARLWTRQERVGLRLRGLASPESVSDLVGLPIWARREALPIDENSEYFWADLIGKQVVDVAGADVGIVRQVMNFGASDIVELERTDGMHAAIPLVSAYFEMSFKATDETLNLTVPLSIFADVWE